MMGSRYPEEKPYSFYSPEEDWEGLRVGPPHHRSAPVSPRGPMSPRASPPGIYPPDLNHRPRLPGSPHEQPFSQHDLEQDLRDRPRQGINTPFRPSEAELGYYNPSLQNPQELDSRSRGVGRGTIVPPLYVNPNSNHLPIPQGAPPNGRYGPRVPSNDNFGQGTPPSDGYRQGTPPSDNYRRGAPPNDNYGRGTPPNDNYGRGTPPNDNYRQGTPPNDIYRRGAPPNDNYGRGTPPNDSYGRGAPPNDSYGRGAPPNDNYGRGVPPKESYARGTPPNESYARGAPFNDRYGLGALPTDNHVQGVPPNDNYGHGASPNNTYGRGSLESGYVGRGVSGRVPSTPSSNNYGAPASGTRPLYGEESSGYARGFGRGQGIVPLGDGRYEYGGLHQPQRLDMAEDYNGGASPPAPISSEYAHQVYASVFSDPVYGGARQLNSQAGYHEEPNSLQQEHHREDVLRHPDDF